MNKKYFIGVDTRARFVCSACLSRLEPKEVRRALERQVGTEAEEIYYAMLKYMRYLEKYSSQVIETDAKE